MNHNNGLYFYRAGLGGLPERSSSSCLGEPCSSLCFVVDNNIGWVAKPLVRRGFRVIQIVRGIPDYMILQLALRTGCIVITRDRDFIGKPQSFVVPSWWFEKYNSWEIVTKIIKYALNHLNNSLRL